MIIIESNTSLGLRTLGIELDGGVRSREDPYWEQNNNLLINQNRSRDSLVNYYPLKVFLIIEHNWLLEMRELYT